MDGPAARPEALVRRGPVVAVVAEDEEPRDREPRVAAAGEGAEAALRGRARPKRGQRLDAPLLDGDELELDAERRGRRPQLANLGLVDVPEADARDLHLRDPHSDLVVVARAVHAQDFLLLARKRPKVELKARVPVRPQVRGRDRLGSEVPRRRRADPAPVGAGSEADKGVAQRVGRTRVLDQLGERRTLVRRRPAVDLAEGGDAGAARRGGLGRRGLQARRPEEEAAVPRHAPQPEEEIQRLGVRPPRDRARRAARARLRIVGAILGRRLGADRRREEGGRGDRGDRAAGLETARRPHAPRAALRALPVELR